MGFELTEEQQSIVDSDSNFLRVIAFAGAGKTSTLVNYAKLRPDKKILYLAFNKSISEEAKSKFPGNVICQTTHSIAYREVGLFYRHKLTNANVRPQQLAKCLKLPTINLENLKKAGLSLKVLNHFLASEYLTTDEFVQAHEAIYEPFALRSLSLLWKSMIDPENLDMPMLHDGYLKLFQTKKPSLKYDIILLDEAQDSNPATIGILKNQSAKKIFVGDPHQQIYQFRRAVNAMSGDWFDETLYLTQSFRFGQKIAGLANTLLKIKGEEKEIIGNKKTSDDNSYAFIARGNASVFSKASFLAQKQQNFQLVGGVDGYRFGLLMDLWNIKSKNLHSVSDALLKQFKSFDSVKNYAETLDEKDLLAWINVITNHDNWLKIPSEIELIHQYNKTDGQFGTFVTTAHKSKGLEFTEVELSSDYPEMELQSTPSPKIKYKEDELNVLYVAITRAKKRLLLPKELSAKIKDTELFTTKYTGFLWDKNDNPEPKIASVSQVIKLSDQIHSKYGFNARISLKRFNSDGWFSVGFVDINCPYCHRSNVEGYRKPYRTTQGVFHYWGLLCLECKHLFDPNSLIDPDKEKLKKLPAAGRKSEVTLPPDNPQTDYEKSNPLDLSQLKKGLKVIHKKFGVGAVEEIYYYPTDINLTVRFGKFGRKKLSFSSAKLHLA